MRNFIGHLLLLILLLSATSALAEMRVYHIDVEQADATLFVSPSGKTLLVDSGKNNHGARIKTIMDLAGVTKIDHFVATHYHEDHYGGIDDLVNDFGVQVVASYDRGGKSSLSSSKTDQTTYKDYDKAVGKNAIGLNRGDTIPLDPEVTVTVIASGGVVLGEQSPVQTGNDENDNSVALLVEYNNFRYFIGGDIEHTTEDKIAIGDLAVDIDVYQANHHGSHTSSSRAFLEDMSPSVVVISNGNNGRYQHPRQVTLNSYETLSIPPTVFQTNKYLKGKQGGNVPDSFIADIETSDTDGTILITADPFTSEYTVRYRNESHSFPFKSTASQVDPTPMPDPTPDPTPEPTPAPLPEVPHVVITELLPNPEGSDSENETVTLRNRGASTVSLSGWRLRDKSDRTWSLSGVGSVAPNEEVTIQRSGMSMSLNNSGDTITLLDDEDQVKDTVKYDGVSEDEVVFSGH